MLPPCTRGHIVSRHLSQSGDHCSRQFYIVSLGIAKVGAFERFQKKKWSYINISSFHVTIDDDFTGMTNGL